MDGWWWCGGGAGDGVRGRGGGRARAKPPARAAARPPAPFFFSPSLVLTSGDLHALSLEVLGVARRAGAPLAELLEVLELGGEKGGGGGGGRARRGGEAVVREQGSETLLALSRGGGGCRPALRSPLFGSRPRAGPRAWRPRPPANRGRDNSGPHSRGVGRGGRGSRPGKPPRARGTAPGEGNKKRGATNALPGIGAGLTRRWRGGGTSIGAGPATK